MKEAHLHMGGGGGGWFCPPPLSIKTDIWLGKNDWGLVIGKPPRQRALSPTRMLAELLACQSLHHAPLWCRGKWVVGVGPLITSSREHRPPWGMRRVTLLSSLNTIFICYFFSTLAGQQHSYTGRGTCTSSLSSRTGKDMSPTTAHTEGSSHSAPI